MEAEKGIGFSGAGVTRGRDPPHVATGTPVWVSGRTASTFSPYYLNIFLLVLKFEMSIFYTL